MSNCAKYKSNLKEHIVEHKSGNSKILYEIRLKANLKHYKLVLIVHTYV